jgi:hypothetical protein
MSGVWPPTDSSSLAACRPDTRRRRAAIGGKPQGPPETDSNSARTPQRTPRNADPRAILNRAQNPAQTNASLALRRNKCGLGPPNGHGLACEQ